MHPWAFTPPWGLGEQHQELSCLPAVQPKAQCHCVLWEHLGSELGRQNRFQEAPLVGSQRGKVARGKTHKQTSLTLRMLNIHVRHLLRVNSHLSGKPFNATLALVLCPRTSGGSQTKYTDGDTTSRSLREHSLLMPAQNSYLEPHPSATPARGSGVIDAKGINWLSCLQILQQVSKGSSPVRNTLPVSLGCSRFKFRLRFNACRNGCERQSCEAAAGDLGSLSAQPQGGRRSAQHSTRSPATLPLPPCAQGSSSPCN